MDKLTVDAVKAKYESMVYDSDIVYAILSQVETPYVCESYIYLMTHFHKILQSEKYVGLFKDIYFTDRYIIPYSSNLDELLCRLTSYSLLLCGSSHYIIKQSKLLSFYKKLPRSKQILVTAFAEELSAMLPKIVT